MGSIHSCLHCKDPSVVRDSFNYACSLLLEVAEVVESVAACNLYVMETMTVCPEMSHREHIRKKPAQKVMM